MSIASQAVLDRIAAFRETLEVSGKTVELMAGAATVETVSALVNQGLDAVRLQKGEVDFGERNKSHVECLRADLTDPPSVGQHWKDEEGEFHRIQIVRKTDITWKCDCLVQGPDEETE